MRYEVVVFGVKDTTYDLVDYIEEHVCKVDLIVTVGGAASHSGHIAGFKELSGLAAQKGIELFEAPDYALRDESSRDFFEQNEFGVGISMGWQRLIPAEVLGRFAQGVFGFHGSCGYLPYGRGRSPLNWSLVNGDTRFILNMFRYDEFADSPNVFKRIMFEISEHDTIRTLQYKNLLCAKALVSDLIGAAKCGDIPLCTESHDPDTWYEKRTLEDGKIDFGGKTRDIHNLIRAVTRPFPGAFALSGETRVILWDAVPFDQMLDFSAYQPGEVIDVFDGNPIVRTIDGSLLIKEYESSVELCKGSILK